ncbi:MAG: S1C family serine protease [Xanthobacteraceae bacterium]|nr:S1C family serine protease [Xanthobacteraceae bacterium]
MPSLTDWKVPPSVQPKPADYGYDLDRALSAVVGLRATIPADAFTAETLGTERAGNGVLIRKDGVVLTIGYLITEAETVWLHLGDGRVVPGHGLGYDQETGFGLVQALAKLDLPALAFDQSGSARVGEPVVVGGAGGRSRSVAAKIVARQEFAGYWEYVLDQAIFTAPAHPNWGGTALIGAGGDLLGIGSLQLEGAREGGRREPVNMIVPIDLLKPILDDMLTLGRRSGPPRPWLGIYATEIEDKIVIMGLAKRGPAERAGLQTGDVVLAAAGAEVDDLAGLFRKIWSLGDAGVEVSLKIWREGDSFEVRVNSGDRNKFLKGPRVH